ncbi:hypothetical protein [Merismopedia glauca]|uniref:Uncharacterized protein n=1 Tax=Merismopedia glauca CCAP 1448/3 TaxID=1296344 RepID=A0A2T1C818_9CYAN|nr:hypothetical protein [Merismopedia glauca]PSB04422.1 hypothetical protein C7B64_03785 [Merismopedia glauca CCAP 1448/3]
MSEVPICSIAISSEIPADEIEYLETSLQMNGITVQKSTTRVVGADDVVFIATVLGGVVAAIDLIERGIKLAQVIKNWRKELRSKGIEPKGRLEHPKRPPLDLSKATDEEIEEWLSRK